MNFLNIMLCYHFSWEVVLQGMATNNPTEKQIDAETQWTLKHAPAGKLTEEEMWSLSLQITMIDLHHNYIYLSEYVFFWKSFISKVFVAGFEHVFVCWKKI